MLFVLIAAGWLAVVALFAAICRVAALGDSAQMLATERDLRSEQSVMDVLPMQGDGPAEIVIARQDASAVEGSSTQEQRALDARRMAYLRRTRRLSHHGGRLHRVR